MQPISCIAERTAAMLTVAYCALSAGLLRPRSSRPTMAQGSDLTKVQGRSPVLVRLPVRSQASSACPAVTLLARCAGGHSSRARAAEQQECRGAGKLLAGPQALPVPCGPAATGRAAPARLPPYLLQSGCMVDIAMQDIV